MAAEMADWVAEVAVVMVVVVAVDMMVAEALLVARIRGDLMGLVTAAGIRWQRHRWGWWSAWIWLLSQWHQQRHEHEHHGRLCLGR